MFTQIIWLTGHLQTASHTFSTLYRLFPFFLCFPNHTSRQLWQLHLLHHFFFCQNLVLSNPFNVFFFTLCLSWALFLCYSFPFFSPQLNSVFLMELPRLNRLQLLTWLSKKEWMGSAERIADAAILAGDVLIERFIGSAGGGHIKEQQLIRTPLRPFTFIYSILMSYLFYLFISSL